MERFLPITDVYAREILDSRGNPTIEVEVLADLQTAVNSVLSGAPCLLIEGYQQAISIDIRTYPAQILMEPLLALKDSLGNDAYYYQVNDFDDGLYAQAVRTIDRTIALYPDRLDYRRPSNQKDQRYYAADAGVDTVQNALRDTRTAKGIRFLPC